MDKQFRKFKNVLNMCSIDNKAVIPWQTIKLESGKIDKEQVTILLMII